MFETCKKFPDLPNVSYILCDVSGEHWGAYVHHVLRSDL